MNILRGWPTDCDCFRIAGNWCTWATDVSPFKILSRAANILSCDNWKAFDCLIVRNSQSGTKDTMGCCFSLIFYGKPICIAIDVSRTFSLVPVWCIESVRHRVLSKRILSECISYLVMISCSSSCGGCCWVNSSTTAPCSANATG